MKMTLCPYNTTSYFLNFNFPNGPINVHVPVFCKLPLKRTGIIIIIIIITTTIILLYVWRGVQVLEDIIDLLVCEEAREKTYLVHPLQ